MGSEVTADHRSDLLDLSLTRTMPCKDDDIGTSAPRTGANDSRLRSYGKSSTLEQLKMALGDLGLDDHGKKETLVRWVVGGQG